MSFEILLELHRSLVCWVLVILIGVVVLGSLAAEERSVERGLCFCV